MKAILLRRPGGPSALEYVELPTPVPSEGEVLVKAIRAATMRTLLDHLAAGRIRPLIHDRLPLAEAARAHELLESGEVIGKLLLKP